MTAIMTSTSVNIFLLVRTYYIKKSPKNRKPPTHKESGDSPVRRLFWPETTLRVALVEKWGASIDREETLFGNAGMTRNQPNED